MLQEVCSRFNNKMYRLGADVSTGFCWIHHFSLHQPLMSLPPNLLREIAAAICRPKGTVAFEYSSSDAFRVGAPGGMIVEIPSGGHYFRLERTQDRRLNFYHSSPATGTRLASLDLKPVPTFERAYLAFTWSPEEVHLHCDPRDLSVGILNATGNFSPISYRVLPDGSVLQLGSEGVQVMNVRVQRGKEVTRVGDAACGVTRIYAIAAVTA
jgi:hypothetical protein